MLFDLSLFRQLLLKELDNKSIFNRYNGIGFGYVLENNIGRFTVLTENYQKSKITTFEFSIQFRAYFSESFERFNDLKRAIILEENLDDFIQVNENAYELYLALTNLDELCHYCSLGHYYLLDQDDKKNIQDIIHLQVENILLLIPFN